MLPQYLAARLSRVKGSATSWSQRRSLPLAAYLFPQGWARFTQDCTQAIETSKRGQAGRTRAVCFVTFNRSSRCPRASSFLPCSRLSRAFPLARRRKKKSTSWLTRRRSASSLCTPASTSKNLSGRAFVSVPITRRTPAMGCYSIFSVGSGDLLTAALRKVEGSTC